MRRNTVLITAALLFGGAAVLFHGAGGCARGGAPTASGPAVEGPNAYDVVKMCRISDEEGPVHFAHALHADLVDAKGDTIPCLRCHHELEETPGATPRACFKCHLPHDHFEARDILTM
jgi:hypothetical protein